MGINAVPHLSLKHMPAFGANFLVLPHPLASFGKQFKSQITGNY